MKVVNNSKALQSVNTVKGVVYLRPGEMKEIDFTPEGLKQARLLSFLSLRGDKGEPEAPELTADAVIAMADDAAVPFLAFKAAASKLLGDKTPSEKDDIILALMELATDPV